MNGTTWSYTPVASDSGTIISVTLTAKDGKGGTVQNTFTVTVAPQAPTISSVRIFKDNSASYNKAEIKFSQPVQDTTVVPGNFSFINNANGPYSGSTFTTDQVNDAYITVEFSPKSTVDKMAYTKGSLKGMNGLAVETQSVTPVLE